MKFLAGVLVLVVAVTVVTSTVRHYGASGAEGGVYWLVGLFAVVVFAALVESALERHRWSR